MCGNGNRRKSNRTHLKHLGMFGKIGRMTMEDQTSATFVEMNNVYCLKCDFSENPKIANYCQQCGDEIKTCPISKMKFTKNVEFVKCLGCDWVFHKQHMDDWMKINYSCPICKGPNKNMIVGRIGTNSVRN